MSGPGDPLPRPHLLLGGALLFLVTLAVYGGVRGHEFVNYDDPDYVYMNPAVMQGLGSDGVVWAFTSVHSSNWHPLTWMSHMLDVTLFGDDAGAHHLVQAGLHALNAALAFLALAALTRRVVPSLFAAALFALHPLHVESVAWIAERKDVLAGTFFFLTLLLYASHARRPRRSSLYLCLGAFALGLLSKPMLVTLPGVLLLLDAWPLGRWRAVAGSDDDARGLRKLILEKLPFFALSAAAAVVTVFAQRAGGSVSSLAALSIDVRLVNAVAATGTYLAQMVWPSGLACFYPHPALIPKDPSTTLYLPATLSGIVLTGITAFAVARLKRTPAVAAGWFWFLGMLVPVIGIVQVGSQAHADRYTYLPLVGVYVLLAFGGAHLASLRPRLAVPIAAAGALALVGLALLTVRQVDVWKDSETLNRHALRVTELNYVAHNNLGLVFLPDDPAAAEAEFQKAVSINPGFVEGRYNLGLALERQEKLDEAERAFETVLFMRPGDALASQHLAALAREGGDPEEARKLYESAVAADPENAAAWLGLARLHREANDPGAALSAAEEALAVEPENVEGLIAAARALEELGEGEPAMERYRKAVEVAPENAAALAWLGRALAARGNFDGAGPYLDRALEADPYHVGALIDQARLRMVRRDEGGGLREAAAFLERALEADPESADALALTGLMAYERNDFPVAESRLRQALELDPQLAEARNNLGLVLERSGRTREGVAQYERVLADLPDASVARSSALAIAWIRATSADETLLDGERAVECALFAAERTSQPGPRFFEILAAAYARAGQFAEAVEAQGVVVQRAKGEARRVAEERLELYREGRPFTADP